MVKQCRNRLILWNPYMTKTGIPSCTKVKQWQSCMKTTLAVQSFNMALQSSPLEANTVGQLLPGVNTIQLYALFTRIKHFLFILWVSLTMTIKKNFSIYSRRSIVAVVVTWHLFHLCSDYLLFHKKSLKEIKLILYTVTVSLKSKVIFSKIYGRFTQEQIICRCDRNTLILPRINIWLQQN